MDEQKAEEHILRSLTQALTKKKSGDSKDYNKVMRALEASPTATLVFWFRSLVKCISLVEPNCLELVTLLLRYRYDGGAAANEAFEKMILNLVSCNQRFTAVICEKLACDLIPPAIDRDELTSDDLVGSFAESIAIRMVSVSPTAPTFLLESLTKHFPNKVNPLLNLDQYTMHVLNVASHCRVLRDRLLEYIVLQMIDIDAEIEVPAGDDEEDDDLLQFDLESTRDTSSRSREMADKLDSLMVRTFTFLEEKCDDKQASEEIFRVLLKVFDTSILPTQRSKHTQFLLFFLCSRSLIFSQHFLAYLVKKTIETESSQFIKETAVGYIASYIARGKFVSSSLIHSTMSTMCSWALLYVQEHQHEGERVEGRFENHSLFYHLCEAIFYMFCFHFDRILDRMTKEECLNTFQLEDIIASALNPFKFCSPLVVRELTNVSHELKVTRLAAQCDRVIERNNHTQTVHRHIEASFPFDPFLLKTSSQWIDDIYCSWEDRAAALDDSYSEDFGDVDLSSSLPDEYDMMSFTPDGAYDLHAQMAQSPLL